MNLRGGSEADDMAAMLRIPAFPSKPGYQPGYSADAGDPQPSQACVAGRQDGSPSITASPKSKHFLVLAGSET